MILENTLAELHAALDQLAATCPVLHPMPLLAARPHALAEVDRLAAAKAAAQLAQLLITATTSDADGAIAQAKELVRSVRHWANRSQGWFEDRIVERPRFRIERDADGKEILVVEMVPFGPYRYFRWREDGKTKTFYLGRVDLHGAEMVELAAQAPQAADALLARLAAQSYLSHSEWQMVQGMCFAALRAQPTEDHWEWQRRIQDLTRAAGKPPVTDTAAAPLLTLAAQLVADVAKQGSSRMGVVLEDELYAHNFQQAGDEDDTDTVM